MPVKIEEKEYTFENFMHDIQQLDSLDELKELQTVTLEGMELNKSQLALKKNPADTEARKRLVRHYFMGLEDFPEGIRLAIVQGSPEPQKSWFNSWINDKEEGFKYWDAVANEFLKSLPADFVEKFDEHTVQSLQIKAAIDARIADLS